MAGRITQRGFTLLEIAVVLIAIGTLAAMAAPGFVGFLHRTRAAEAREVLEAIAHAQLSYFRDHGAYVACAPSAPAVPAGHQAAFDERVAGWSELGFRVDGPVWYRYEVQLRAGSFVAIATGDLDADGQASRFELDGATLTYHIVDELE